MNLTETSCLINVAEINSFGTPSSILFIYIYIYIYIYIIYTGCLKKTGIMEFCIFFIIKGGYTILISVLNPYMIKSIQLATIQAFTVP